MTPVGDIALDQALVAGFAKCNIVADKHRLICAVGGIGNAHFNEIDNRGGGFWSSIDGDRQWDAAKNEVRHAISGTPDGFVYRYDISLHLRFLDAGSLGLEPAHTALEEIAKSVEAVIADMQAEMQRLVP